jgi:hypothetical protein
MRIIHNGLDGFQCLHCRHETIKGNQIDRCGDWRKKPLQIGKAAGKERDSLENHNYPPRGSDNTKFAPIS